MTIAAHMLAALLPMSLLGAGATQEPPERDGSGVVEWPATAEAAKQPVLLVPGWGDDAETLAPLVERLNAAGWEPQQVYAVTFEDPVGSNRDHAAEIARAAAALRALTGAERIDVVAHSMGGLATRAFLQNGGEDDVRRVVFLATPHAGTLIAHFGWGAGAREMEPGSAFLAQLSRAPPVPTGIRSLSIYTPLDLHVVPGASATLPGRRSVRMCCPTHAGLLDHAETFEVIERFLTAPG